TSPPGVGLEDERQPDFPKGLWARFGDRRWMSVDPPEFLDYEGGELVLIGGRDDLGEDLGLDLKVHPKNEETAEIFNDLHMEKSERTIKPLFVGGLGVSISASERGRNSRMTHSGGNHHVRQIHPPIQAQGNRR